MANIFFNIYIVVISWVKLFKQDGSVGFESAWWVGGLQFEPQFG